MSSMSPVPINENKLAQAWVNISASGVVAVRDSLNVDSITDDGVGRYTVNFSSDFDSVNYAVLTSAQDGTNGKTQATFNSNAVDSVQVRCLSQNGASAVDPDGMSVACFGGRA